MGKQRFADVLVHHNPRIRVGASLAYLVYAPIPLFEDENGQLRLGVRGVAYEPACEAHGSRLIPEIGRDAPASA